MTLTTNVLRGGIAINELLFDPNSTTYNFDTDGNGTADTLDEFVELYNTSNVPIDISGLQLWDTGDDNWFTFPDGTILGPGNHAVVVTGLQPGGSLPAVSGGNFAFNAGFNKGVFNNNGDNVVLYDPIADEYIQLIYNGTLDFNPPTDFVGFSPTARRVGTLENWGLGNDGASLVRVPAGDERVVAHNAVSANNASPGQSTNLLSLTGLVINEIHADPAPNFWGDANNDGMTDARQDEFVEIVNNTGADLDFSGWTLADNLEVRHRFPNGTIIPDGGAIAVFGGGSPTGNFGNATVQTASTGTLDLDDMGDTVTLGNGVINFSTYTYGPEGGNNRSLARNPDITGVAPLVQHSTVPASGRARFSPGTQINGSPFIGQVIPDFWFIDEIQGEGHISPLVGQTVMTWGLVTALERDGFYLQDPFGDGSETTSDAIFVHTGLPPTVKVGDELEVTGKVGEFFAGGSLGGELSRTQLRGNLSITTYSTDNFLPDPAILGAGGRTPPTEVIDNDNFAFFDPDEDGIDFYESLEGMRVTVQDAVAVSPSNAAGEIYAIADGGFGATGLSDRGALTVRFQDFNPERIQLQIDPQIFQGFPPQVNVGDGLGDVTGIVDYDRGNFEVRVTDVFTPTPDGLQPEISTLVATPDQLRIASVNADNLDPFLESGISSGDADDDIGDGKFAAIASQIVTHLHSPDIVALQDILDNSGTEDDGVVDASLTYQTLIEAIAAVGGPQYSFFDIPPIDGEDGDPREGNSRVGYLYNSQRVGLVAGSGQRIGIDNPAFRSMPKSLAATFSFAGQDVTVINNHFAPKLGGTPLFGSTQPPINGLKGVRAAQAQGINGYVDDLLIDNPNANIVVLGNFNEVEFFAPMQILEGNVLSNLAQTLPQEERYSTIVEGNAQALDHILVSNNLSGSAEFDIVHTNAEFVNPVSDRDPLLARLSFPVANPPIQGTPGNDILLGTPGNDGILGNDGDDLIWGGPGSDRLVGGLGGDVFLLGPGDGVDNILDFQLQQDFIALLGGLSFGQLSIFQQWQDSLINFGTQTLAILNQIDSDALTVNDFLSF